MTDLIEWQDPPPGSGTQEEGLRDIARSITTELRARPGMWARVWTSHDGTRMPEYLWDLGVQTRTHVMPTSGHFDTAHVYARVPAAPLS